MSALLWYGITFALIAAYVAVVLFLRKRGLLERFHLQIYGPFLMWKTVRGRKFLERLSRHRRFWNAYADVSVWITVTAMVAMIGLLVWSAVFVLTIRPSGAPDPSYVVGLPGINPVIPLWYGILALAVAIVIHEAAHGILALIGRLRIKSLGLLFFVVPVGAFVEPDEDALKKAEPKVRDRMAAVGPATNILFAIMCALL
ncbi:MAG: site-2 protease family protein, partial [Thermoplasmata archaeon]|nr:site-2 protease family protein [Thermoplasmata archaeon]